MFKQIAGYVICILLSIPGFSQTEAEMKYYPTVGRECPDVLIRNIYGFAKAEYPISHFRGRWLVLDFWNKSCGACVSRFPTTNKLYNDFKDRVDIILVGDEDRQNEIRPMYARFKNKLKMGIPYAFDSLLFQRFDLGPCPHIIIIDPKGVVRGITITLTEEKLNEFLNGRTPELEKTYYRVHESFNSKQEVKLSKPLLVNGNGGPDSNFIYRSLLYKWLPDMPFYVVLPMDEAIKRGSFQCTGLSLARLYKYALIGKADWDTKEPEYATVYRNPDLEIKDTSLFSFDISTGKNLFCYSLIFPKGKMQMKNAQRLMLSELANLFGYSATVEIRKKPCWILRMVSDTARQKLISAGKETYFNSIIPHASFEAKNLPIGRLIRMIFAGTNTDIPIINETGIEGNIDIKMDCIMTDMNEIKQALKANGINLVLEQRNVKVVVIKDEN